MAKYGINGTPWHVTHLGMEEGDSRRLRNRCIYFRYSDSYCHKHLGKCRGSSHCKYYQEKTEDGSTAITEEPEVPQPSSDSASPPSPPEFIQTKFHLKDRVLHKTYGYGTIRTIQDRKIIIEFDDEDYGTRELNLKDCIKYKLLFHATSHL